MYIRKKINYYEKYGIFPKDNDVKTIKIIQWYEYLFKTPNNIPLNKLPLFIYECEDNIIEIWKYVIEEKLKYINRNDLLNLTKKQCKEYKIKFHNRAKGREYFTVHEVLSKTFPQYKIKPWEIKRTSTNYFNKDNIKEACEWIVKTNNLTLESILNGDLTSIIIRKMGLRTLLIYFKEDVYRLLIFICKSVFNVDVNESDFKNKPPNYYNIKENADNELRKYVNYLLDKKLLNLKNIHREAIMIFNANSLLLANRSDLTRLNYQYYNNYVFYNWLNEIYADWELKESDFKLYIGCDNKTRLNSRSEKRVFDYIFNNLGITNIKGVGFKRTDGFYNKIYNETYYPDFIIPSSSNKPVIIEYYGLYASEDKYAFFDYNEKTLRKEEYYKNNKDIYYIGIFPQDLKNNFVKMRDKLQYIL